jgi:Meiotically up-regulated gene 113
MSYSYVGLPLSPTMAAELIVRMLVKVSKPKRRIEILQYVEATHTQLGGLPVADVESRVKRALARLVDEGKIYSPAVGFYTTRNEVEQGVSFEVSQEVPEELVPDIQIEQIVAEKEIGQGSESVYVYFSSSDRKLAAFERRNEWPCKVGFTAGNVAARILSQGIGTSMSSLPVLGLVIKSEDAHQLERALHIALDFGGCRIDGSIGSEWFLSSPEKIVAWHGEFVDSCAKLTVLSRLWE